MCSLKRSRTAWIIFLIVVTLTQSCQSESGEAESNSRESPVTEENRKKLPLEQPKMSATRRNDSSESAEVYHNSTESGDESGEKSKNDQGSSVIDGAMLLLEEPDLFHRIQVREVDFPPLGSDEGDSIGIATSDSSGPQGRMEKNSNLRGYNDPKSCLPCVDLYLEDDDDDLEALQQAYSQCVLQSMDTVDLTNLLMFAPGTTSFRGSYPGPGNYPPKGPYNPYPSQHGGDAGWWSNDGGNSPSRPPPKTYHWVGDPNRKGRPTAEHVPQDVDFIKIKPQFGPAQASPGGKTRRRKRQTLLASRPGKPFAYGKGTSSYYGPPPSSSPLTAVMARIQNCFLEKLEFATNSTRPEPIVENIEGFIDRMTGSDDAKRRMKRAASTCARADESRPTRYGEWYDCFWRKACEVCCSTPGSDDAAADESTTPALRRKQSRSVDGGDVDDVDDATDTPAGDVKAK